MPLHTSPDRSGAEDACGANIRPFQSSDAELCSRLVRSCLSLDRDIAEEMREALIEMESPARMRERAQLFFLAVYEDQGGISGLAGLDMNEVRLLCVAPEQQRKGIGSSLLRYLESMVPANLFRDIFVYAAPAAVDFYHAHGYRSHGEYEFLVQDRIIRTVFMTRNLQE